MKTIGNNFPCMILAAGRGERMRPLTDKLPKPLLEIHGQSLLSHHLVSLKKNGFERIVINHAWLGHLIEEKLGNGEELGLDIQFSPEKEALETAGGIATAMSLLKVEDYFFVINGDVYSPAFPFSKLNQIVQELRMAIQSGNKAVMAYLFLVDNPPHNPSGDFYIHDGSIRCENSTADTSYLEKKYTFSGAGLYHKDMFSNIQPNTKAALAPLLREVMSQGLVKGELLECAWHDVGTPERLMELNQA